MCAVLELHHHAHCQHELIASGSLSLPRAVSASLSAGLVDLLANLGHLLTGMGESEMFPVEVCRERVAEIRQRTLGLLGADGRSDVAVGERTGAYRRGTDAWFSPESCSRQLARDILGWRQAYLSFSTSLGVGNHLKHVYPNDGETLYRMWCALHLGRELVRAGKSGVARQLALSNLTGGQHSHEGHPVHQVRNYFGDCLDPLPSTFLLGGGPPLSLRSENAGGSSVMIHTHYGSWSREEHLLMMGWMMEAECARAVLIVTGEIESPALRSTAFDGKLIRCVDDSSGIEFFIAELVPDEEREEMNRQVIHEVVEHVLA